MLPRHRPHPNSIVLCQPREGRLNMTHPFAEEIKREARADKAAADAFIRACQSGDAEALYQAVDGLNLTIDGWRRAMRKVTRHVQSVAPDIQEAFAEVW